MSGHYDYDTLAKGTEYSLFLRNANYEEFILLKIHLYKDNGFSTKNSENKRSIPVIGSVLYFTNHGRPIIGNNVCIQVKHAWISWCKPAVH